MIKGACEVSGCGQPGISPAPVIDPGLQARTAPTAASGMAGIRASVREYSGRNV